MTNENPIEFKATKGKDTIAGYVYLSEIDDENCIHFYNNQGLENGTILPRNPHNEKTDYENWLNYEQLKETLLTDIQLLQFLADFADEIKSIERENYTLKINTQEA